MKITKCLLVASAAALAGSLLHNVPSQKNEVFKASVLDPNVQQMVSRLHNCQGRTNLDNFANFYFSNLNNNFGVNAHGTCSFVSMGMLLSFYDTYLNDSFIPDSFEQNTFIEQSSSGTIITKGTESPGVTYDDYVSVCAMDNVDYEDYVIDNPNASFQNFLINYACDNDFDVFLDHNGDIGLTANAQAAILDSYLSDYAGLENRVYCVTPTNNSSIFNAVKNILSRGEPVILNLHSYVIGNHSVVAYDYDDEDIYVHTGWKDANGNALTHVSLQELSNNLYPGTTIKSYIGININNLESANNLNNYYTVDENDNVVSVSPKTLAVPFDFRMEYNSYTPEVLPEFKWNSLYNERWFNEKTARFQIKIRDFETNDVITLLPVVENATSATIPEDVFNQLLDNNGKFKFVVEMKVIHNEAIVGTKRNFTQRTIITNYQDYEAITPNDYGFPTRNNTFAQDFIDIESQSGIDFKVRKTSNVCASGKMIRFSPNLKNTGDAYIEYNFYKPITQIKLDVNEYGQTDYATASNYERTKAALFVQGFKNGQYFPDLSDASQAERHANNLIVGQERAFNRDMAYITYDFSSPVYRVRINVSAVPYSIGGLIPKGKASSTIYFSLYLGNVYVKPVDGDYLAGNGYEFHTGNMEEPCLSNDYGYALSLNPNVVPDDCYPGEYTSDEFYDYTETEYSNSIDIIAAMCEADAAPGGLTGSGYRFEEIDKDAIPSDGCYKIALAITAPVNNLNSQSEADFKFFRQDSDGTWSFVNFQTGKVTNKDFTGRLIYDPSNVVFKESELRTIRSPEDIVFFQVSRNKGSIGAEEEGNYFPYVDHGADWHEYTWDEHYYIIQPPFRPIFTGEF